jgi:hypothetical protein
MDQRTKLGWAWKRREDSTDLTTGRKADGSVVLVRAMRKVCRRRKERLSCRGAGEAM